MSTNNTPTPFYVLPDKVYQFLKYIAFVVLPAVGTFYVFVDLPNTDVVAKYFLGLATLLGTVLTASSVGFSKSDARFDGTVNEVVSGSQNGSVLLTDVPAEAIESQDEVTFKVDGSSEGP